MKSNLSGRSGLLRLVMLLAVSVIAVGGLGLAGFVYPSRPDPETATPDELLCWLATTDLGEVGERERSVLARRLEREYRGSFDPVALREQVAPEYYDRVLANLPILLRTWLFDRADSYFEASPTEKKRLLEDSLAAVDAWGDVQIWTVNAASAGKSNRTVFLEQVAIWRNEADPTQRERLDAFLCDLQAARLMKRLFGGK